MRLLLCTIVVSSMLIFLHPLDLSAQSDANNTYEAIEQLEADSENMDAAVEAQLDGGEPENLTPVEPVSDGAEVIDLSDLDLEDSNANWQQIANPRALNMTDSINVEQIIDPRADYRYSAFGKKDPFATPTSDFLDRLRSNLIKEGPIAGEEIPIVSPLQAYAITKLLVTGVWIRKKDQQARAVVVTPKGEAIVVKKGDPISAGKVLEINRNFLLTRQYNIRSDGAREYSDIKLTVRNETQKDSGIIRLLPGKKPQFLVTKSDTDGPYQKANTQNPNTEEKSPDNLAEKANQENNQLKEIDELNEPAEIKEPAQTDLNGALNPEKRF